MKKSAASVLSTLFAFGLAGSVIAAYTSLHGPMFQTAGRHGDPVKSLVDPWSTGEPASIGYWPPKTVVPASRIYGITPGYAKTAETVLQRMPYVLVPTQYVSGICGRKVTCPPGLQPIMTRALSTGDPGETTQAWATGSELVVIRTARKGARRSQLHRPVVVLVREAPARVYVSCR